MKNKVKRPEGPPARLLYEYISVTITNPPVDFTIHLVIRLNDRDHVPQEVHLVVVENLMIRE